jgi:hypothetical protein
MTTEKTTDAPGGEPPEVEGLIKAAQEILNAPGRHLEGTYRTLCRKLADALTAAMASDARAVRLGRVLTFRRLQNPTIAKFLNDADPFIVREAALEREGVQLDREGPADAARKRGGRPAGRPGLRLVQQGLDGCPIAAGVVADDLRIQTG